MEFSFYFVQFNTLVYICAMHSDALIIGICGGSGSGKTTLINNIIRETDKNDLCLISLDNYYHPRIKQTKDNNGKYNFDLPEALDEQRIVADLQKLMRGETVVVKEYNFNTTSSEKFIELKPAPVFLVEGLFVLHYPLLRNLLTHKIFIDVHPDIQLKRRLRRDVMERGYPEKDVLYQWENHVVPSFKRYLEPYKEEADLIITNNENFEKGWKECCNLIQSSYITG